MWGRPVFREVTEDEVEHEVVCAPCPVQFVDGLPTWGKLDFGVQYHTGRRLYRGKAKLISVQAGLRKEEALAVLVHEIAHAKDISLPTPANPLENKVRAEIVAFVKTLREFLRREAYLPLVTEMHAIEWDAEGQGDLIYHQEAGAAVRESPIWQECRDALLWAMNDSPPRTEPAYAHWEGHGASRMVKAGRNLIVIETEGNRITDFEIAKFWPGDGKP